MQRSTRTGVLIFLLLLVGGAGAYMVHAREASFLPLRSMSAYPPTKLETSLVLELGHSGIFQDITITPLAVLEDSRCSAGVVCVWAGQVRVEVAWSTGSDKGTLVVSSQGTPIVIPAFPDFAAIAMTGVEPAKTESSLEPSQYRFTFRTSQYTQ